MVFRSVRLLLKLAAVFAVAAFLAACVRDDPMTVKYPLVWAAVAMGGPTGEWLWGDCDGFAAPRRQAQLCELRRQAGETPTEREMRLARARPVEARCLRSLADRTCHADVQRVLPGGD